MLISTEVAVRGWVMVGRGKKKYKENAGRGVGKRRGRRSGGRDKMRTERS